VNDLTFSALSKPAAKSRETKTMFSWETMGKFVSLRERDSFLAWMHGQIVDGVAEEIQAPVDIDTGERWFRHLPTGSLWRLVSAENPYGPGFWPACDKAA